MNARKSGPGNMGKNDSDASSKGIQFWAPTLLALLERAAFFGVAPFFVIYLHEVLGMTPTTSTVLNGSLLWGVIHLFPLINSRLVDYLGTKQSLAIAFVSLSLGYFLMGNCQRIWPGIMGSHTAELFGYAIPVIISLLLIGTGCSLARTGTAGSVQLLAGERRPLALGVFFLVINLGALSGLGMSFLLRTKGVKLFPIPGGSHLIDITPALTNGFSYMGTPLCLIGLLIILFLFRDNSEPEGSGRKAPHPKTPSLPQIISGMFRILKNRRQLVYFSLLGFFWLLYAQIFNLIPLYLRFLDSNAPIGLYIMALPVTMLTFQLLVSRYANNWTPGRATITGMLLAVLGVLVNLVPAVFFRNMGGKKSLWGMEIPLGGVFVMLSLILLVIGEMILSPHMGDYRNSRESEKEDAPPTEYTNLPVVLGIVFGAPLGGILFERLVTTPLGNGQAPQPMVIWLVLSGLGLLALLGLVRFHRAVKSEQ